MTRPRAAFALAAALAVVAVLVALGAWQLQRRAWKHRLVAQVEARLAAPPVAAPGPASWRGSHAGAAYTRVSLSGRFRPRADTFVQAVTALGGGYWVLTPLDTAGWTVLVNRGFVPAAMRDRTPPPGGAVRLTGLLRLTEPGGGFLRSNDPATDRWYSRDVAAIAAHHGLARNAPYFIDQSGDPARGWPRPGLTVVSFSDNHLVYAFTWFGLAVLTSVMTWRAWKRPA